MSVVEDAVGAVPEALWPATAVLVPLLAAVALLVADRFPRPPGPRASRAVAVTAALLAAVATVVTVWRRPETELAWIPSLGVRLDTAVDGISAPLLLLTAVVGVVAVALPYHRPLTDPPPSLGRRRGSREGSDREVTAPLPEDAVGAPRSLATYYACLLLVTGGALLAFLTRDAVVFFVAFEIVLVPMWVLVARHGDAVRAAGRDGAALRFVLVTATGSTLMLVGILALATATGTTDLGRWAELAGSSMTPGTQLAVAALLLLGLGLKVPVWPLHTWLPWVHATAPTAGSVLLAAVLLKLGVYGIIRLAVAGVPGGFTALSPLLAGLAVTGTVWAGLACLVEPDLKRLIAWSSVAHLGFVVLALATGTQVGLQAAVYGNVAHGLVSALLFVVVGELKHQWGGADLRTARAALREAAPRLGFLLVVGMAAAMGLPGLATFWGEFGALYAAWSPDPSRPGGWFRVFAVVAALGAVLAAAYTVRVLREVWSGDRRTPAVADARGVTWVAGAVLSALVVGLGVYPVALTELSWPAVAWLTGAGR